MQELIHFEGLDVSVQAEKIQPVRDGCLLYGEQVALLNPFGETRFLRNGFHSWSLSSWIPLEARLAKPGIGRTWPMVDHPRMFPDYPFASSGLGALQSADGKILLLAALKLDALVRADRWLMSGEIEKPNSKALPAELVPGEPSPDWLLAYGPEQEVLGYYAARLADLFGRTKRANPPRVWCSWYSYYREISEQILVKTAGSLEGLPFDVLQVDDGWQICLGDWEPNPKFSSGMQSLAKHIRQKGFIPGLWLAPLIVQPHSSLLSRHPEWMLRDEKGGLVIAGHNWGDVFYTLDTTQTQVQEWLSNQIRKVRSWGYDYLKLDFLYAAALPGVRQRDLPGEQAYRLGLSALRLAAGDAYLLVCGAPVLASLGLADGMRVGPDVTPFWDNVDRSLHLHDLSGPGTLNAIRTTLHRLWLRPLVHVDPDVAFFRSRMNLLDPQQKQLLQDLVSITGFLATSDPPEWLDPDELRALQKFLEQKPEIEQLDRYRFQVGGREVDFGFLRDSLPGA